MIPEDRYIMKKLSFVFILVSGILWGCLGMFVRKLNAVGLVSMDIVFLRAVVTAVAMAVFLLIFDRRMLKIRWKDIWCFLGTGIASITFFNFCYFKAVTLTSMSVAAVLLYTAPAIVMVLSYFLFKEQFSMRKGLALVMTFVGCVLVTGVFGSSHDISAQGILLGLGAGFGYALYSIFSRYALDRGYHSLTITLYTFVVAAIATGCMTDVPRVIETSFGSPSLALLALSLGILCTVVPYLLYTMGLVYVENSRASIIASVEPVTATVLGIVLYQEQIRLTGILGIGLVIGAMAVCSRKTGKPSQKSRSLFRTWVFFAGEGQNKYNRRRVRRT